MFDARKASSDKRREFSMVCNMHHANHKRTWPRERITVPSSLVVMVPSPSRSNRLNASLNSAICSSVNWSACKAAWGAVGKRQCRDNSLPHGTYLPWWIPDMLRDYNTKKTIILHNKRHRCNWLRLSATAALVQGGASVQQNYFAAVLLWDEHCLEGHLKFSQDISCTWCMQLFMWQRTESTQLFSKHPVT